jgi:hypothetical protein
MTSFGRHDGGLLVRGRSGDGNGVVMSDVVVRAQRLPGIGWRYSLPTDPEIQLMVVEDRGPLHPCRNPAI